MLESIGVARDFAIKKKDLEDIIAFAVKYYRKDFSSKIRLEKLLEALQD